MTRRKISSYNLIAWIVFIIGIIAFFFSSGKYNVPVAAWIWPIGILFFVRRKKNGATLALACILMIIASCIKWYGAAGSTVMIDIITGAILGFLSCVPFLLDYFLYERISGFKATLLFPLTFASIEIFMQIIPMGLSGPVSATQTGNDLLMQIVSIFGSYGITILVTWLAPVCIYVIDHRSGASGKAIRAAVAYGVIILAVLAFGGIRLTFADLSGSDIEVALTTGPYSSELLDEDSGQVFTLKENLASFERSVETASTGGADILLFSEEAFTINDTDEEAFIKSAENAAKENHIDILITFDVMDTDNTQNGSEDNVEYLIDYQGNVVWKYYKNRLVPLMESNVAAKGDGIIPSSAVTFPSGKQAKIASVICMDSDYPRFIRDGLADDTEILLIPTWDWAEIRAYHTKWVELRAIENGVSLVRSTINGVSTVTDPYGRVIMTSDTDSVGYEKAVFSEVPAKSVFTIYKYIGCVLDWCYVAGLAVLILIGIFKKRKDDTTQKEMSPSSSGGGISC